jgi:acyl carrier protein
MSPAGILDVVARTRGLPAGSVDASTPLSEIAPDSFDRVELLLAIEEQCGLRVSVPPDAVVELATIGDLVASLVPAE